MPGKLKVLVVDDVEMNRIILSELFADSYNVLEAENGEEALETIRNNPDLSAVLLDIVMPVMDGLETLEQIKKEELIPSVPIFFVTADTSNETLVRGFENGIVDRIEKPFNPYVIKCRIQNSIELYDYRINLEKRVKEQTEEIERKSQELKEANASIIDALSTAIEFRDSESGEHVCRIRQITKTLLIELEKQVGNKWYAHEEIENISAASTMHDVGKISVPDYILNKPGKLTAEEFEIMKEHTVNGCKILDSIDMIKCSPMYKYYYDICRSHHERWDGRGYPDGLVGDMIPISAQIVSVVDVYDALTSKRVYKPPYSHEKAVDMILNGECGKFNPDIIECLKNCHMELKDILDKMAFENKVNLEIPQYERKKVSSKLELENSENFDKTCKNDNADKEDSFTVLDDDVIFKYNKKNDIIEFSETYAKEFGKARLITNAQKFFYEDPSMTPEEKEKLMNSVNKLNINNPVLNCRIKVRDKNGSPVSRNISIYMHYSNENSGESDGFVGKLVNS